MTSGYSVTCVIWSLTKSSLQIYDPSLLRLKTLLYVGIYFNISLLTCHFYYNKQNYNFISVMLLNIYEYHLIAN